MGSGDNNKFTSLALLLAQPREVNAKILREAAERAFRRTFATTKQEDGDFLVHTRAGQYALQVDGKAMGVIYSDAPYWNDPKQVASQVDDPKLARLVIDHRAWISVDWFDRGETTDPRDIYQMLSALVLELLSEDARGVYATESGKLFRCNANLRKILRSGSPMMSFAPDSVSFNREDDPRMLAAIAKAKRRWPEFILHWGKRKPGHRFGVKRVFNDGHGDEVMWVIVESIENGRIVGTLNNEPSYVTSIQLGATVEFGVGDVVDFFYSDGQRTVGAFTDAVLRGED